jgi:tRNA modification GTPase
VIVAVATPPGRGAIGVVRLSGPGVADYVDSLIGQPLAPRRATLASFRDADGSAIDRGIALYFPGPTSYTGEDVLELQGHGGPVVMQRLVRRCIGLGARPAEPGEFSLRAFLNERIDLAQAEAVADLIDASSEAAAKAAMRSLDGEFSARIHGLVGSLTRLRTFVEATLDFPEEDVEFLRAADASGKLSEIRSAVDAVLELARRGSVLREGIRVVLIGRPNVGKSSLMNRLAGEDVAIVTEVPGTTRDALLRSIEVEGLPVHVIDTAGLRETEDHVERLGIERTWSAIDKADLALLIVDARAGPTAEDLRILDSLPANLPRVLVRNKIDLTGEPAGVATALPGSPAAVAIRLSAKTGAGIELLAGEMRSSAGLDAGGDAGVLLARERHLRALREARDALERAAPHLSGPHPALELFAEELRMAQQALATITGAFTADDLLGEIFAGFCIGK